MSDEHLRRLEREAQADPIAAERLTEERARRSGVAAAERRYAERESQARAQAQRQMANYSQGDVDQLRLTLERYGPQPLHVMPEPNPKDFDDPGFVAYFTFTVRLARFACGSCGRRDVTEPYLEGDPAPVLLPSHGCPNEG